MGILSTADGVRHDHALIEGMDNFAFGLNKACPNEVLKNIKTAF